MQNLKNITNKKNIFVDCFGTIILRNKRNSEIITNYLNKLSAQCNIPNKLLKKLYKNITFWTSVKIIFKKFSIMSNFNDVMSKIYDNLSKKYLLPNKSEFINKSNEIYLQEEISSQYSNKEFVDYLIENKKQGKKIYMISDFYCNADTIKIWLNDLKIGHLFNEIFSSCDYNKEKATTKLYKHVLDCLKINPKDVIMFGDNLWSDVFMAKLSGIKSKRIKLKRKET